MTWLVDGLANLSSLRDREELDFALVNLVRESGAGRFLAVRLLRLVGEVADLRWQVCADLKPGQEHPERDRGWVDWTTLPSTRDFPERQRCLASGSVTETLASDMHQTLFPVGEDGKVEGILELETLQPVDARTTEFVVGILRIFRNVQGLLDYGEKDSLTELLNRKTFDRAFFRASLHAHHDHADGLPERRTHHGGGYWLAVMDIDHFKRVNDNFGHLIGDEVLLLMARLMRASFRLNDQLYRFGGEEFVILMRCMDAVDARNALERFRLRVEAHDFPQVGRMTASIGFTPLAPDDTPSTGFDRADKSVYYAKTHGRNQVCSYTHLVASGELIEAPDLSQDADFF